jgi:hypothetical protein
MKKFINLIIPTILSAIIPMTALNAQNNTQDALTDVTFSSGENGGALEVAQSIYGVSKSIDTAVIDLNGDSNPEIAVRILDNCSDNNCQTTILYNNGDSWLEIFNHSSEKLSLKKDKYSTMYSLETGMGIVWKWYRKKYVPQTKKASWISDIGEKNFLLTKEEASYSNRFTGSFKKYLFDVTGDKKDDSILISTDIIDCGGHNICPYLIFSEEKDLILEGYANEGLIGVHNGKVMTQSAYGLTYYAYNGQYMMEDVKISASKIVAR